MKGPFWLTKLRDELGSLADRREKLRGELEAIEQRHERVAIALSVWEEVIAGRTQPGIVVTDAVVDDVDDVDLPLTDRVRAAISSGLNTRRLLLEYFASRGVSRSKVDSAMSGMRKRGTLERAPGRRWVVRPVVLSSVKTEAIKTAADVDAEEAEAAGTQVVPGESAPAEG